VLGGKEEVVPMGKMKWNGKEGSHAHMQTQLLAPHAGMRSRLIDTLHVHASHEGRNGAQNLWTSDLSAVVLTSHTTDGKGLAWTELKKCLRLLEPYALRDLVISNRFWSLDHAFHSCVLVASPCTEFVERKQCQTVLLWVNSGVKDCTKSSSQILSHSPLKLVFTVCA
jgi:hypothetical protein